jgi:hypothetical protein
VELSGAAGVPRRMRAAEDGGVEGPAACREDARRLEGGDWRG